MHKKGCKFKGMDVGLVYLDPTGHDPSLDINETGITYSANIHNENNEGDWALKFNYCPVCGVKLS